MSRDSEHSERSGVGERDDAGGGLDTPPPFWGRWSRLYWLVAGLLVADVLAFWLLTRWAS